MFTLTGDRLDHTCAGYSRREFLRIGRTVNTMVAKTVMKQVTSCRMVPVCVTDPCTGCTHTCCKAETVVTEVPCTVYECASVSKSWPSVR